MHWALRVNRRNRTGGFAMLLVILGLHMAHQDHGTVVWLALVAQFLVYPQVAFWLANRAADPFEAEVRHMQLDALSFGTWLAVLHFPLWIGFILLTSVSQNLTLYLGRRGLLQSLALFLLGCGLAGLANGWTTALQTDPLVTTLAIVAILLYQSSIALDSQRRSMRLFDTKQQRALP